MTSTPRGKRGRRQAALSLGQVCTQLQQIAPTHLAQKWDNVGLLAGDRDAKVHNVMLCIDLMPDVVDEAIAAGVELVVSYHPPIFRPIKRLVTPGEGMEAGVLRCISNGIAVYSPHTALDVAVGGTNDVLAEICGVRDARPLEYAIEPSVDQKLVTFVPVEHADDVCNAMFAAGAGLIGNYSGCSFRQPGEGGFLPGAAANPAVGTFGQFERVEEFRVEVVVPTHKLSAVVEALREAHPYEEAAFDVYPRTEVPRMGIGRVGALDKVVSLRKLAKRIARKTGARCVSIVGDPERLLKRAIVGVGAAGSMPFALSLRASDVIVTGEMRHHDALHVRRLDCSAIALSHWSSERPMLATYAEQIETASEGKLKVILSERDCEPFQRI